MSKKNTEDLLKDVKLEEDEILVSFDVEALFPNVPVDVALSSLKYYVDKQDISKSKK